MKSLKNLYVVYACIVQAGCAGLPFSPTDHEPCYEVTYWMHVSGDSLVVTDSVTYEVECP